MAQHRLGWFLDRAKHLYYVVIQPIWSVIVVVVIGVLLMLYQTAISVLIPPDKRDPWDIYNLLPKWQWGWYVLLAAIIVLFLMLEGSYRLHRKTDLKLNSALADLADIEEPIRLYFDDAQQYWLVQMLPDAVPRLVASVSVENIGHRLIEHCYVRSATDDGAGQASLIAPKSLISL